MDIIADAHTKRFKLSDGDETKKGIVMSEAWSKELLKHPFISSKLTIPFQLTGKHGTGIFLMKERAKLYKVRSKRTTHEISKRLS